MSSWEVWSTNSRVMFPCLRELQLKRCSKLIDVSLEALPSLRFLIIDGCCESVLRNLVRAASSTTKLKIKSILGLTDEVWRGVTENIEAVEELTIRSCDQISYLWESEEDASKVLVNLRELVVSECKNLVRLEEKEEDEDNTRSNLLSSLRILNVSYCNSMERLCCPNCIESLDIFQCRSLRHVSLSRATTTGGGGQNLKSLRINGCGNLKSIDQLSNFTPLTSLSISRCQNLKSIDQLSTPTHLTSLGISSCQKMELFPDLHQLSNLTSLYIQNCQSIESFPNLQLPNLTHLEIKGCKNMKAFGDLQLPNLIKWRLTDCENLESFPDIQLSNLTKLKDMCIRNCPKIDVSFPCGLWPPNLFLLVTGGVEKAYVTNFSQLSHLFPSYLTNLSIWNFDKLESLSTGLQRLTSLQHLQIWYCPKVSDLPETLLPSLLSLEIKECPVLKERCSGRGSHYWPLISHIPSIRIYGR